MAASQLTLWASAAAQGALVSSQSSQQCGREESQGRLFNSILRPRVSEHVQARLHLPPRSHHVRCIPADSLGASKKQPEIGESYTWNAFVKSLFMEDTILLFFKDHEGQITSNEINRSDFMRCRRFASLVQILKGFLYIPENEKLQIQWGRIPLSDEDLHDNWNQVKKKVPTELSSFNIWKRLKSIKVICCEPVNL